ncbi:DUF11 domain-containing protein [Candidatus Nomurabacteria bacterium]|nr:DUF11 domain-containing protein [Candidatus Nomurabacteria bacterium]
MQNTKISFIKSFGKLTTFGLLGLILIFGLFPFHQVKADVLLVSVAIVASPANICDGESANLSWSSTDATSITISPGVGSVNPYGSLDVTPSHTTTYTITGTNSTGGYATASATVYVSSSGSCGGQNQDPTVTISADDTNIAFNDNTTVRWSSNNADSCVGSGGANGWSGNKSLSGSFNTGALTSNKTFTITCTNNSGSDTDSVTITVDGDNQNNEAPEVTTKSATSINKSSATLNGRVDGNGSPTRAWFEWGEDRDDLDEKTSERSTGSGINDFEIHISGLDEDTTYYFRAVAENDEGDDFGSIFSFRTDEDDDNNNNDDEPEVTTKSATSISRSSATLNGRVDGNGSSTKSWFEWGTSRNDLDEETSKRSTGSGTDTFESRISGLRDNTTYYFRAVAENREGDDFGSILSFRTDGDGFIIEDRPIVSIYADQTNLPYNGATFIRWNALNANSCFASGGSTGWAGAKSIGSGSFYTGSLTGSRTYNIVCNNSGGSASDSVTVSVRGQIINPPNPTPSSLVLITSSIERNQPIQPTLDNSRPHPGDEINYTVSYQNIGTGSITNLNLRIILPREVDYLSSSPNNPNMFGDNLSFNLGTLRANGEGKVEVRVRVREDAPAGTLLDFPATLSYIDPSGQARAVDANVTAEVFRGPGDVNFLGANVFGAGFWPESILGWLFLIILIFILIITAKHAFTKQPEPTQH